MEVCGGQNANHICLISHQKDLGFNTEWDGNTSEVFKHKPEVTWHSFSNKSLWLLCWYKIDSGQGRPFQEATAILQTKDESGLVQSRSSKMVTSGKILDIFWRQCPQNCLMFWAWIVKERHQFWTPWTRRMKLLLTKKGAQVWAGGRKKFACRQLSFRCP